eukprot:TRINITY_DN1227_c0_g3_i4.p1 TRINITY_DN1227_c0_g3~~TRINITY_DN1227_c0_g3_i4.p1  ORF type:complete len:282 (-),score=56.40 TRINITY_DN1227_c0_g3_i4:467-1312(-)
MNLFAEFILLSSFILVHATEFREKEYVINLSLPPRYRYTRLIRDHADTIREVFENFKKDIPEAMWTMVAGMFKTVAVPMHREYAEELIGISEILNITVEDLYVLNCINEIVAMCTSIVARDKNGKLILARNFDFYYRNLVAKMHVNVIYKRNGRAIARCGNIAGYIGIFTCMKPNTFAISMNTRIMGNVQEFLQKLQEGRPLTTWVLRETVLNARNYEDAVRMLKKRQMVTGSHITLAGVKRNEGTVITFGRDAPDNIREISLLLPVNSRIKNRLKKTQSE